MSIFLDRAAAAFPHAPRPLTFSPATPLRLGALAYVVLCGACFSPVEAAPKKGAKKAVSSRKTTRKRARIHRAKRPSRRSRARVYAPVMMPPQGRLAGGAVSPLPVADAAPHRMIIMHPDRGAGAPKAGAPQGKGGKVVHVAPPAMPGPSAGPEKVPRIQYGTSEAHIVGE